MALLLSVGAVTIDGEPGFVGILRDVRPEVTLREALRARDAEYASVVQALSDGFVVQRPDGTIVTSNPAAHSILGLTADQLVGRTSMDPRWKAIREDGTHLPGHEHPAMVTLTTGAPIEGALMGIERGAGDLAWLEISTFPIHLNEDAAPGVVSLFKDVTQARSVRQQIADSERSLRLLADNATDMVLRSLPDTTVVYASPASSRSNCECGPPTPYGRGVRQPSEP